MDEQGEVYISLDSQNTSYEYEDYNPEIMTLSCGWSLQDALIEDLDYVCDEDSGEWGIKAMMVVI
jgi:hypothetical protein